MKTTLQRTDLSLHNKIKLCAMMLRKHLMYVKNGNGEKLSKFLQHQKQTQPVRSLDTPKNIDTVGQEALDDIV